MSDPSPPATERREVGNPTLSRRGLFAGGLAGAAALYGLTAGGAAARSLSPALRGALAAGTVSFGSNGSDPVPKKAYANVFKAFTKKTGIDVKVNTVDHNTFQEQINTYLQGQPQDVFTWFAGYRMQFFASKGLLSPLDDVWAPLKSQFASAYQNASKGADGHYYFVPIYAYPWAVHYRKSVWKQHGYTVPKTWDQFVALAKKMQADGLTPIAFTDKDGWPAMGTFDIINMRMNGYDFHVRLMAGKARWDSPQVKRVFNTWREILPYTSDGALGLTWQEGAQQLANKEAGMNRTFENPVELTVRAVLEERPDLVRQAAMLDPNTAATLTLDEIDALCDELTLAHGDALPGPLRASRRRIGVPAVAAARSAS